MVVPSSDNFIHFPSLNVHVRTHTHIRTYARVHNCVMLSNMYVQ
jgi:hypothetical protein